MNPRDNYALRKAQLVAQCDLERLRMQFALGHIRRTVTAPVPVEPTVWAKPVAATLLGFAVPALGVQRVHGIVEMLSMAFKAYRAVQAWRTLQPTQSPPATSDTSAEFQAK